MIAKKWLLVIGLVSYAGALAWTVPARLVAGYVLPQFSRAAGIELENPRGRALDGSADLVLAGRRSGQISWRIRPLSILAGRIGADLEVRDSGMAAHGLASAGFGEDVTLTEIAGESALAWVKPLLPPLVASVDPGGDLSWRFERIEFRHGVPEAVEGNVFWKQAAINFPERLEFGRLKLALTLDGDGGIRGTLSDETGPLKARGQIRLSPDGSYRVDLGLAARNGPDTKLGQTLARLGTPDRQGMTPLTLKGRL